jgi:hypothetical protein
MKNNLKHIWALVLLAGGAAIGRAEPQNQQPDPLDSYNVVWTTPSDNAHGSMPLGNGDVGINAWVEANGDLIFYVSKTDAWDENAGLCKIGRVRVTFDPPLTPKDGFRQELKLRDGMIEISGKLSASSNQSPVVGNQVPGSNTQTSATDHRSLITDNIFLRLWVDSDQPVVRVETESVVPVTCRAEVELWRLRERPLDPAADYGYGDGKNPLAQSYKLTVLPDVVAPSSQPQVVWYHRNTRSLYPVCLEVQHLEALKGRFTDPLLNHTFGASLRGVDMVADGAKALKSNKAAKRHQLSVCVLAERAETPDAWLKDLGRAEKAALQVSDEQSRLTTSKWWQAFWNRSWVFAEEDAGAAIPLNAHPVTLGADSKGGTRFRGEIAAAAMHERALSPAEMLDRKPPTQPGAIPQEVAPANRTWPNGLTLEAWVKPAPGESGRIFDKCTPGHADGFLLDTNGSSLRLILGPEQLLASNCLKPGQWQHVAVTLARPLSGGWSIYVDGKVVARRDTATVPASEVTNGYVLQRYMNACSGRGASPIKFNGSIFTVEKVPGSPPESADGDPDWRNWGGSYWFQNTRLSYWPMLASGDFEMMEPWFRMYLKALPLSKARMQQYYKFEGAASFQETMNFWGMPNNRDWGWGNAGPEPGNACIGHYFCGGMELTAFMLDRYDFTQDATFARNTLVPLADPIIAFFDQYWPKRDPNGKIIVYPAQALEAAMTANPMPDIAGLRFILPRLLALPHTITTEAQRTRWARILNEMPPLPAAEVDGVKVLLASAKGPVKASENPELYAVFPYRLFGVGKPDLDLARATYDKRYSRINFGWCQDSIQAACLGLGAEAGRQVALRARINRAYRFPAMFSGFDWIPDQDHGANILTTLQYMLLQSDGQKIYVLPAWPKSWNVSFKLHAPYNTTVEGELRNGKLLSLKVTPQSRAADVVNMLAP